ncbi:MAG TPA: replication-relaxation family protein [Candidatus Limnocylindrales bacterium]|nr:replication-relaxation family protein [Candidatus Limnocylindrales bacterium]
MTIPYITPKQQEIPRLIYKFRFLNRLQIQKLLKHKHHKRIIDWLNDLVEKDYIQKVSKNNTFEERTKLTIYSIGINGIRFLKIQDNYSDMVINKLYRDKDRSVNFINQCILLCDIYLDLQNINDEKNNIRYNALTHSDFVDPNSSFHFLLDLNPNLIYEEVKKCTTKSKVTKSKYFLVEIFETTMPSYSINKRIRTYIEFYYSNEWEDNIDDPFPTIKFICPTKAIRINTKRYTKKLLEDNQQPEDLHIRFATIDEVKEHEITGEIWEEAE